MCFQNYCSELEMYNDIIYIVLIDISSERSVISYYFKYMLIQYPLNIPGDSNMLSLCIEYGDPFRIILSHLPFGL